MLREPMSQRSKMVHIWSFGPYMVCSDTLWPTCEGNGIYNLGFRFPYWLLVGNKGQ